MTTKDWYKSQLDYAIDRTKVKIAEIEMLPEVVRDQERLRDLRRMLEWFEDGLESVESDGYAA